MPYDQKWQKLQQENNNKLDRILGFFKTEGKKRGNSTLFKNMESAVSQFNDRMGDPITEASAIELATAGEELEKACDAYLKAKKGAWTSSGKKRLEMAASMKQFVQEQNLGQIRDIRSVNYTYGGFGGGKKQWKSQMPFRLMRAVLPGKAKEGQGGLKERQKVSFTDIAEIQRDGFFTETSSAQAQEYARKNIAASRIAEYVHAGRLFVHWEKMEAQSGDRELAGCFIEEADGIDVRSGDASARQRLDEAGKFPPTEDFLKDMADLKVIDYLCNQTRRRPEDMAYKIAEDGIDKGRIIGVQRLDMGSAFEEAKGSPLAQAELKDMVFISGQLAKDILRLDEKKMQYLLKDLIPESQLQTAITRMNSLQEHIKKNMIQLEEGKGSLDQYDPVKYSQDLTEPGLSEKDKQGIRGLRSLLIESGKMAEIASRTAEKKDKIAVSMDEVMKEEIKKEGCVAGGKKKNARETVKGEASREKKASGKKAAGKLMSMAVLAGLSFAFAMVCPAGARQVFGASAGWQQQEDGWYYYNPGGSVKTGWIMDKGKSYYLDETGRCAMDTMTPDGYYVDGSGAYWQRKAFILDAEVLAPERFLEPQASIEDGYSWYGQGALAIVKGTMENAFGGQRVLQIQEDSIIYLDKKTKEPVISLFRNREAGEYRLDLAVELDPESDDRSKAATYNYQVFLAMLYQFDSAPEVLAQSIISAWSGSNSWGIGRQGWTAVADCQVSYMAGSGYGSFRIRQAVR